MRRLVFILLIAGTLSARAADRIFESGPVKVHLIELFTSQGCSSCPPAEAWLSKLKSEPGLWKDFIPLAFHVDYWDRLGWRDPFAAKQWTARQYQYSEAWKNCRGVSAGRWRNERCRFSHGDAWIRFDDESHCRREQWPQFGSGFCCARADESKNVSWQDGVRFQSGLARGCDRCLDYISEST